jgi:hypothetical protein
VNELKEALSILCEASDPNKRDKEYYRAVGVMEIFVYGFDTGAQRAHQEFVQFIEERAEQVRP